MSTRAEKQAATRQALLHAASRVFAEHGLKASLDQVAAEAGYTKGAVYANFKSKEELFLAMLDDRFAGRLAQMDRLIGEGDADVEDTARRGAVDFVAYLDEDRAWERLFFEAATHAGRDEHFRTELLQRYDLMRDRMAAIYARLAERAGVPMPIDARRIAAMIFAMANGVALERTIDPRRSDDSLFPDLMSVFVRGLLASLEDPWPAQTETAPKSSS